MNKQEIFTRVATHLLTQKRKARNIFGYCQYRYGGLRCAVGCLIDDKHYSEELEECGVEDLQVQSAVRKSLGYVSESSFEMLAELQNVHDEKEPRFWRGELSKVASQFSLKMPS